MANEKPLVRFEDDPYEKAKAADSNWDIDLGLGEVEFTDKPPEEEEKPKYDDIMAKLKEYESERQDLLKRGDDVSALKEAVANLGQLQAQQPAVEQPVKQPEETWESFNERVKEQLYGDRPADVLREAWSKIAGGDLQALAEYSKAALRETTRQDPEKGVYFQRYEGEIEAEVNRRPDRYTNPNVYKEATDLVTSRHLQDIIAEEVAKQVQGNGRGVRQTPNPQFAEGSRFEEPAAPQRTRIVTTPEDERKREALNMSKTDYYAMKRRRR